MPGRMYGRGAANWQHAPAVHARRAGGAGGSMGPFYANAGPERGTLMHRDLGTLSAIGVQDAPGNVMPIGMALCVGWHPSGAALWRLIVRGAKLPGTWY